MYCILVDNDVDGDEYVNYDLVSIDLSTVFVLPYIL